MSCETLRILRGLFLRAFVIGVAIVLMYALATLLGWRMWVTLVTVRWALIDARTFGILTVVLFAMLRFVLVFGLLVPGLALHWTLKRELGRARMASER